MSCFVLCLGSAPLFHIPPRTEFELNATVTTEKRAYRDYRAPQADGQSLVVPDSGHISHVLSTPHEFELRSFDGRQAVEFCGKTLGDARSDARQEIVQLARDYTYQYLTPGSIEATDIDAPLILSGHQPELFHPGVWYKNFLLDSLAKENSAIAINFLVDNDLCRRSAVRVVRETSTGVSTEQVAFDRTEEPVPWELRKVASHDLLASFPARLRQAVPDKVASPLVAEEMWPEVLRAVDDGWYLGQALARGRHHLEHQHGLRTLELPQHTISGTRSFARFVIHLLTQLPRFIEVHNDQLLAYRSAHKIRNHAHPVPELKAEGGWLEAPLWIYSPAQPERRRLWVKAIDDGILLSDRSGFEHLLNGRLECDRASDQWLDLAASGVCVRPRALVTTMFMRLFVGDLFVHGIGGAKYDQLTDTIIEQFFGFSPPPVCVATATVHLPLSSRTPVDDDAIEDAKQKAWQLQHNPDEALLDDAASREQAIQLVERKRELVADIPDRGSRQAWHQAMKSVKQQLVELAQPLLDDAKDRVSALEEQQRQDAMLRSREFSCALFSADSLLSTLSRMATR